MRDDMLTEGRRMSSARTLTQSIMRVGVRCSKHHQRREESISVYLSLFSLSFICCHPFLFTLAPLDSSTCVAPSVILNARVHTRFPSFASFQKPKWLTYDVIDHCADSLRQYLQCTADVSVLRYNWMRGVDIPIPTARNPRKCRNFDDVMDWAMEHQAPAPASGKFTKPMNGSVQEIVPLILDDNGRPISDQDVGKWKTPKATALPYQPPNVRSTAWIINRSYAAFRI